MRRFKIATSTAILILVALTVKDAQSPSFATTQNNSEARIGLPGRRISGGSRSPNTTCLATPDQPVIALMPKNNLGLTLSEYPTFWFSLPAISPDRTLEFGLYDQDGDLLYQTTFSVSGQAEVASLSLPKSSSPLVQDADYRWYLSVVCDRESHAENLVVTGWIRRVQPSQAIDRQLTSTTDQERLAVYQNIGLWYDALTLLAQLRYREPLDSTLEQQWIALLESVDLSQASAVPLGNELTPIPPLATIAHPSRY